MPSCHHTDLYKDRKEQEKITQRPKDFDLQQFYHTHTHTLTGEGVT